MPEPTDATGRAILEAVEAARGEIQAVHVDLGATNATLAAMKQDVRDLKERDDKLDERLRQVEARLDLGRRVAELEDENRRRIDDVREVKAVNSAQDAKIAALQEHDALTTQPRTPPAVIVALVLTAVGMVISGAVAFIVAAVFP